MKKKEGSVNGNTTGQTIFFDEEEGKELSTRLDKDAALDLITGEKGTIRAEFTPGGAGHIKEFSKTQTETEMESMYHNKHHSTRLPSTQIADDFDI